MDKPSGAGWKGVCIYVHIWVQRWKGEVVLKVEKSFIDIRIIMPLLDLYIYGLGVWGSGVYTSRKRNFLLF